VGVMAKANDAQQNPIVVASNMNPNIVPYVFSLDRIEKPNCNICQCDFRDEAEEAYDNQKSRKNYSAIKRMLKDNHDFDVTVYGVKNHMQYHYKAMKTNASMQEYAEDIQKWVNMQTNKVASIKTRIALLERLMFTISLESEDLDIMEKRKSAETVKKLVETIITCETKLSEYAEEIKPVNLVFNQLKNIVSDELAHVDSQKAKKVVSTILTRLHDSMGDMLVD
jgi:Zn-dependent oligopeptidase